MLYTSDEISNIHLLAQDADLKNVLLAFELIRGRGLVQELLTDVYWIYNRMIWVKQKKVAEQIYAFLKVYWLQHSSLTSLAPLLANTSSIKLSLNPYIETQAKVLNLDLPLLAKLLYQHFSIDYNPLNSFLFKYGNKNMQTQLLPFLKIREHTGRFLLDLGGFRLKQLPTTILVEKHIQVLKIWGNELEELPNFWDQFPLLEVLNIAENQLRKLPPSFIHLQKLQKLYAQNNAFVITDLLTTVKQLPNIKYLTVANPQNTNTPYTLTENKTLSQFEELVNHGKIHTSEKEQTLFLALLMKKNEAIQKLSLSDLFKALSDPNEEIRKRAKQRILNWKGSTFNGELPTKASIAILGIVSFATRSKLNRSLEKNIHYSTEITKRTTHIVVGDYPESYKAIEDRSFIFMTEEDL